MKLAAAYCEVGLGAYIAVAECPTLAAVVEKNDPVQIMLETVINQQCRLA